MTVAARITQADMKRAINTVKAGGFERARIVMDLAERRIEIIIGESEETVEAPPRKNSLDRLLRDK